MENLKQNQQKVSLNDIGLYLRIIQMDYFPKSKADMAQLISEHFNVICNEEDIIKYEQLYSDYEDYEKLSRMLEAGNLEHFIE